MTRTSFSSSGRAFFNLPIVSTFKALSPILHSAYYRCVQNELRSYTKKESNKQEVPNIQISKGKRFVIQCYYLGEVTLSFSLHSPVRSELEKRVLIKDMHLCSEPKHIKKKNNGLPS